MSIYLYPRLDTDGNLPVRSVYVCPSVSWTAAYKRFVRSVICSSTSVSSVSSVVLVLDYSVEVALLTFFRC
jgi:hypothetical protein